MKYVLTLMALMPFMRGENTAAQAAEEVFADQVGSLLKILEEETDEGLRKKAVEELVQLDNRAISFLIEALGETKRRDVKEALVEVLSHTQDERAKSIFFDVLETNSFSARAKERAVFGLSQLTRVVNRASIDRLNRLHKQQASENVQTKIMDLVAELEPLPEKENKFSKDPSSAEMHRGLQGWARTHPDKMDVEIRGESVLGKPILLVKITDKQTSNDNKSIVLFTSTHCGNEEIGATSLLHLTKWLLGGDELAKKIREQIVVLIMPCANPDGWDAHRRSGQPYHSRRGKTNTAWNVYGINIYDSQYWFGPAAAEENPEGIAILNVAEEFHPDASMDIHSTQRGLTMPDSTGFSWGDFNAHSFQPLIVEEMNQALEKAGCLAERPAMDSGRIKIGFRIPGEEHNYYRITNKRTIMTHLYRRYHTLAYNCEAAFDFAVLARARRLLEIGTETWRNEFFPGYPSKQVGRWGWTSVAAWGDTASKRRKSRVELWGKMNQIHFGGGSNYRSAELIDNKILSICATTTKASEKWIGNGSKEDLLANLSQHEQLNFAYITKFVKGIPLGMTNPPHYSLGYKSGTVTDEPIRHGLSMRLFVPYKDAEIYEACIDGYEVDLSEVEGYLVRSGPGTIVQFNIPPSKVGEIHVVSLKYKVAKLHKQGFDQELDWELKQD